MSRVRCTAAVRCSLLVGACLFVLASAKPTIKICVTAGAPTILPAAGQAMPALGTTWQGKDIGNHLQGMGVDLILAVFGELLPQYDFTTTIRTGFSQILYQTRAGICDVSVQNFYPAYSRSQCSACLPPPTNTAALRTDDDWEPYACCIDFSHAYFPGGWSLLTEASTEKVVNVWKILGQKSIIQGVCYATLLAFAFAHLVWLCERTAFPDASETVPESYLFKRKYFDGLRDGTWFAATTAMSNALHNKMIITGPGRLVAVAWVGFGMFLTAFVTSIFSSTLTAQQLQATTITTAYDMAGRSLCIQAGFYNFFWDSTFPAVGVRKTFVSDDSLCPALVISGEVDAALSTREKWVAYFATGAGSGLAVTPVIAAQDYALSWSFNFSGRQDVNSALLNWLENDTPVLPAYKASASTWYGGDAGVFAYGSGTRLAIPWNGPLIIATCVILGVYMLLQGVVILGSWSHHRSGRRSDSGLLVDGSSHHKGGFNLSFLSRVSGMLSSKITDQEEKQQNASIRLRRSSAGDPSNHSGGWGGGLGTTSQRSSNAGDLDGSRRLPAPGPPGSPFVRDGSVRSGVAGGAAGNSVQMTIVPASPFAAPQQQASLTVLLQQQAALQQQVQQQYVQHQQSLLQLQVVQQQMQQMGPPSGANSAHLINLISPVTSLSPSMMSQVSMPTGAASFAGGAMAPVVTTEITEDQVAHIVDEVVNHLGEVTRAQVRRQVHEAMMYQKGGGGAVSVREAPLTPTVQPGWTGLRSVSSTGFVVGHDSMKGGVPGGSVRDARSSMRRSSAGPAPGALPAVMSATDITEFGTP